MEPYFADGCPLIEMEKGDRPGKKERENTKKSRGAEKKNSVSGGRCTVRNCISSSMLGSRGGEKQSYCDSAL